MPEHILSLSYGKDSLACPSAHFNKTDHDFDRRFQMEDEGLIYQDDKVFRWSMLDEEMNYRWF